MAFAFELTEGATLPPENEKQFDAVLSLLREDKVKHISLSGHEANTENLTRLTSAVVGKKALESLEISGWRNAGEERVHLLAALGKVPNLSRVTVKNCFGDLAFAKALADLLSTHPRISKANVQYNTLNADKADVMAEMLTHNGGLRVLDIGYNAMGDKGVNQLAAALEKNKGLVSINVDTCFALGASVPHIERMLETNKNMMHCVGIESDTITERLEANQQAAKRLAAALAKDPSAMSVEDIKGVQERMAAVSHLLEIHHKMPRPKAMELFTEMLVAGRQKGTDSFPAMMAVFPLEDMFDLSAKLGTPLSMKDFHTDKGATPLLKAVIQRGAGAALFRKEMQWQSGAQIDDVYKQLPEAQQRQVTNRFQLKAYVQSQATKGFGRRENEISF